MLSAIQGYGISTYLETLRDSTGLSVVAEPGWGFRLMTMVSLTTGTAFIMWLGEQITERGIGNGISLVIFAGIVVALPGAPSTRPSWPDRAPVADRACSACSSSAS